MGSGTVITILLAMFFAVVGVGILAVAVCTPNWYYVQVNRTGLQNETLRGKNTTKGKSTVSVGATTLLPRTTMLAKPVKRAPTTTRRTTMAQPIGILTGPDRNIRVAITTRRPTMAQPIGILTGPDPNIPIVDATHDWYVKTTTTTTTPSTTTESPIYVSCPYYYCYSRSVGLFYMCFKHGKPVRLKNQCQFINYYVIPKYSHNISLSKTHYKNIHCSRSAMAFMAIGGLVMVLIIVFSYLSFCLRWSAKYIGCNALFSLIAFFMFLISMACFHGALYFENHSWDPVIAENSDLSYNWGYIIAWIGVACILISSCLFNFAAGCRYLANEEREDTLFTNMNWGRIKYHWWTR